MFANSIFQVNAWVVFFFLSTCKWGNGEDLATIWQLIGKIFLTRFSGVPLYFASCHFFLYFF